MSPRLAVDLRDLDEVEAAAGLGFGLAHVGDDDVVLTATDPAELASVMDLGVASGSIADLGPNAVAL